MTSNRQSRPARAITRSLSEQAGKVSAARGITLIQYMAAALVAVALLVSVRPILAALTAVVDLAR